MADKVVSGQTLDSILEHIWYTCCTPTHIEWEAKRINVKHWSVPRAMMTLVSARLGGTSSTPGVLGRRASGSSGGTGRAGNMEELHCMKRGGLTAQPFLLATTWVRHSGLKRDWVVVVVVCYQQAFRRNLWVGILSLWETATSQTSTVNTVLLWQANLRNVWNL